MRRGVVISFLAMILACANVAVAQSQEIVVDRIMARVDDSIITRSDMVRIMPIYMQVVGRVDPASLRTREGQEKLANDLLEYMIDSRLLLAKARQEEMVLSDADLESYLRNYRESLGMNQTQFRQVLAQEGMDYDDYREFMRGYLTRMQMLRSGAAGDISVLEEEVEATLRERYPDGFRQPYFTTSHILITVPQGAPTSVVEEAWQTLVDLRAKLISGEVDFGDAALEYNADATRYREGEVGTFTLGELDPEYTRAALALEPGEISEPVRSQFGLHLVRLDAIEVRDIADLEGLKNRIRYELREAKVERAEALWLRRLRDANFVQVMSNDFGI